MSALNKKVATLEKQADDQEQYSQRNCLLLHGIDEDQDESTDVKVINIVKDKLEIEISASDIDRSHRIGKKSSGKKRPIIIKFAQYNCRRHVYHNKKKLNDSGMSITESLTKFRLSKLNEARDHHGFRNVWAVDGRIVFKDGEDKPKLDYRQVVCRKNMRESIKTLVVFLFMLCLFVIRGFMAGKWLILNHTFYLYTGIFSHWKCTFKLLIFVNISKKVFIFSYKYIIKHFGYVFIKKCIKLKTLNIYNGF